jgi:hypothetical protein
VATRRIAWDWVSTKKMLLGAVAGVQSYTATRKVESGATLDALRRVRDEVAEQKFKPGEEQTTAAPSSQPTARPDPTRKFEARGVEGDITQVVGGAVDKPVSSSPKSETKASTSETPGGHTGSLLEAKRRARQQMEERERGEQQ